MPDAIPVVRLVPGLVVQTPDGLAVNVNGSHPPVWWPAGYIPTVGDNIRVLMVDGTAIVSGPVITGQRPLTGTVDGTAVGGTVPVDTASGTLACRYVGDPPVIGELVRLDWQSTTPWVWPSAAAVLPDAPMAPVVTGPAAPPSGAEAGSMSFAALDSATWNTAYSAWSSFHKTNLAQGTYGGQSYSGSWFYGAAPSQLAGRTMTAGAIRLGARLRMGNYNDPLTLRLWRHTSNERPGGDVTRVEGPHDIVLAPGAPAGWYPIPTDWAQDIADNGGGVGISGGTYGGIDGIGNDPASGQLAFNWTRS